MNKKIKILLFICLLIMFVIEASNTYAKYVSEVSGEVKSDIAMWQILVNQEDITSNYSSALSFTPVILDNDNVASNKIAPGSEGYFDISINPSNVETSFTYSINLSLKDDAVISDIIITDYAIINSVDDEATKIPFEDAIISNNLLWDNDTDDFAFSPFIVRVYFKWDSQDNTIINDESVDLGIVANISFSQYLV